MSPSHTPLPHNFLSISFHQINSFQFRITKTTLADLFSTFPSHISCFHLNTGMFSHKNLFIKNCVWAIKKTMKKLSKKKKFSKVSTTSYLCPPRCISSCGVLSREGVRFLIKTKRSFCCVDKPKNLWLY